MSVVIECPVRLCLYVLLTAGSVVHADNDAPTKATPARFQQDINNENEPQVALPEAKNIRQVTRSRRRASRDPLVQLCQETVEVTSRRMLSTDRHTPWQMIHAILGLREDFQLMHNGNPIDGLDWISEGQVFDNEYWFEKTRFGGRAHPYSRPYAFEGHAHQTIALLSMSGVPLDREFDTATGPITMRQMIKHAQMTVSTKDEPTWTLWVLSRYLPPNARWRNQHGEMWSIERLVALQLDKLKVLRGNPCGGTHGLFALAHARNVYMATHKIKDARRLRGVWARANSKINEFINYTYRLRNSDGSLGHDYFRSRKQVADFNKRMASIGHTLEFLMISVSERQLKERWVRQAIEHAATQLMNNRNSYVKCSPLYHTLNAINIYLDRVNPKAEQVAQGKDRKTVGREDNKLVASTVSQSRMVPPEIPKAKLIGDSPVEKQPATAPPTKVKPTKTASVKKPSTISNTDDQSSLAAGQTANGDQEAAEPQVKKTVKVGTASVTTTTTSDAGETTSQETTPAKATSEEAPKSADRNADLWKPTPEDERLPILVPKEKMSGLDADTATDTKTTEKSGESKQDKAAPSIQKSAQPKEVSQAVSSSRTMLNSKSTATSIRPADQQPRRIVAVPVSVPVVTETMVKDTAGSNAAASKTVVTNTITVQAVQQSSQLAAESLPASKSTKLNAAEKAALQIQYPNSPKPPAQINHDFTAIDADLDQWTQTFESTDRDIVQAQSEILAAINLSPSQAVADIGCGTGLFVKPLAEAVGSTGIVYAIEISPRFVEYLDEKVIAENLENVAVVRCEPTNLLLGQTRLDKVLLCETYHCFEHPVEMLDAIFDTLRPNGEVLLIEPQRIPGISSTETLQRVRADKDTFLQEFQSAGFELVEEVHIPTLADKYVLKLRRPAKK